MAASPTALAHRAKRAVLDEVQHGQACLRQIVHGQATRTDLFFIDSAVLGLGGLVSVLMPTLVTGLYGGGFSSSSWESCSTRTVGVYMVGLAALVYACGHGTDRMSRALLLLWALVTFNAFAVIVYSTSGTLLHFVTFLGALALTGAHALDAKLVKI